MPFPGRRISLFGWLFAACIAALGCGSEEPGAGERAYGVQLHLHGSMSEGRASMRAHAEAASRLDGAVDVLWWTDHDWRMAAHGYVERFDFEEGLEAFDSVPAPLRAPQWDGRETPPEWRNSGSEGGGEGSEGGEGGEGAPASLESVRKLWRLNTPPARLARDRLVEVTAREARHGARSLHLGIQGGRRGREGIEYLFQASRRRQIASLASEVTLAISALPIHLEGDSRLRIRVALSQTDPEQSVRLDYELSRAGLGRSAGPASRAIVVVPRQGREEEPSRADPGGEEAQGREGAAGLQAAGGREQGEKRVEVVTIPLEATEGVWNDWRLELSRDARRYGLGGADNALVNLSLGLEVSGAGRAEFYLDSLVIERERVGEPLLEAARGLADALSGEALIHHVGQEISYAAHLNAYGSEIPLVDYRAHPHGLTPREAVAHIHRHGGLASLNHFFGIQTSMLSHRFPASRANFLASLERLIANHAYGVDLLEVGYRSRGHGLDAFVELWDGLAEAGIRLVGVGVSDSHDADVGWSEGPNNFISWIYAASRSERDLLEGLGAGRVFFGDPTRFRGLLDIRGDDGGRMGETRILGRGLYGVTFRAEGLAPGQTLRLIRDGRVVQTLEPETSSLARRAMIDVQGPGFVRLEVMEGEQRIALSNPLYVELAVESAP
jgi:hypothetical protein